MKGDTDIKPALQQLDDYKFEKFLGDLWAADGWDTRVLQASNDRGIDVLSKVRGAVSTPCHSQMAQSRVHESSSPSPGVRLRSQDCHVYYG